MKSSLDRPGKGEGTFATAIYAALRADIIAGTLPPGIPLRTKEVCQRYAVGLSPAREALNRLSVEGFVAQTDHKGFAVAAASRADLVDLIDMRCWLTELALRRSIAEGDEAWEEAIALAFHRLSRAERGASPPLGRAEWRQRHRAFHDALIGASRSARLAACCEALTQQVERYSSLAAPGDLPRSELDEHRALMDATLDHDADRAVALQTAHLRKTGARLLARWDAATATAAGSTGLQ